MKKTIFTILLTFISVEMLAQQVMLADSITKNPVCYATVYDANGTVIGRSDMGGYIKLQKGFEYNISHIVMSPGKTHRKRNLWGLNNFAIFAP